MSNEENQRSAKEEVQSELGKPRTETQEKEYFLFISDELYFRVADIAYKDDKTGDFGPMRRVIKLAGKKSKATNKRTYLTLPNTRKGYDLFMEKCATVWKMSLVAESVSSGTEVDNLSALPICEEAVAEE